MYRLPVYCYTAVDLASSDSKTASRTVVLSGAMDYRKNAYLLDYWIRLGSHPFDTMSEISRQASLYHSKCVGIEKNRYEAFLSMYRFLQEKGSTGADDSLFEHIRITDIEHYGRSADKIDRITDRVNPFLGSGSLYIMRKHVQVLEHIEDFPQPEFLDLMDALEMFLAIARAPSRDYSITELPIGIDEHARQELVYDPLTLSWNEEALN